jgi:NADH:ubiquinone oxidoreductase subunit K
MGLILLFGYSSLFYFSIYPLIISILLVVISAAEIALGLTLIIYLKKIKGSINLEKFIYVH